MRGKVARLFRSAGEVNAIVWVIEVPISVLPRGISVRQLEARLGDLGGGLTPT